MDLDFPNDDLRAPWAKILHLRKRLISGDETARGEHDSEPPRDVQEAAFQKTNWKGKLQELYNGSFRKNVEKGEIKYTTSEVTSATAVAFRSVVEASRFQYAYHGQICHAKKLAEHSAAHAAICAEFPDYNWREALPLPEPDYQGSSRALRFKSELHETIKALTNKEVTRDDLPYETSFFPDNDRDQQYVARVTLACLDKSSYTGRPAMNKKLAEQAAAEARTGSIAEPPAFSCMACFLVLEVDFGGQGMLADMCHEHLTSILLRSM